MMACGAHLLFIRKILDILNVSFSSNFIMCIHFFKCIIVENSFSLPV